MNGDNDDVKVDDDEVGDRLKVVQLRWETGM
jgi:hypothetical protein